MLSSINPSTVSMLSLPLTVPYMTFPILALGIFQILNVIEDQLDEIVLHQSNVVFTMTI